MFRPKRLLVVIGIAFLIVLTPYLIGLGMSFISPIDTLGGKWLLGFSMSIMLTGLSILFYGLYSWVKEYIWGK